MARDVRTRLGSETRVLVALCMKVLLPSVEDWHSRRAGCKLLGSGRQAIQADGLLAKSFHETKDIVLVLLLLLLFSCMQVKRSTNGKRLRGISRAWALRVQARSRLRAPGAPWAQSTASASAPPTSAHHRLCDLQDSPHESSHKPHPGLRW